MRDQLHLYSLRSSEKLQFAPQPAAPPFADGVRSGQGFAFESRSLRAADGPIADTSNTVALISPPA